MADTFWLSVLQVTAMPKKTTKKTTLRRARTLGLAAALVAANVVLADEKVDKTLSVNPLGTIRIHNPRGDIEVTGWDRDEVRVEGELDDLAKNLVFRVDGDVAIIRVELPRKNANWGDGSELDIRVPQSARVLVDGLSSDIDVSGVQGEMAIRSVSGDVDVDGIESRTRIKTVSGDVDVSDGAGPLGVTTTSGDVDIDVHATRVVVDSITGDVDLKLERFDRLIATSKNGALHLSGELNAGGQLVANTTNADIDVELRSPVNARIQAVAMGGGSIDNDLTDDKPRKGDGRRVLTTVAGDGSGAVKLTTVNGAIEID